MVSRPPATRRTSDAIDAAALLDAVDAERTFKHAGPNVLLNYGASDALARVARLATGASIVFGFPLVFSGFYDSATRLLPPAWETSLQKRRGARRTLGSLCLVFLTAQVALAAGDIGLPAGLAGSLLGGFVVYVLPAMIRWPNAGGGRSRRVFDAGAARRRSWFASGAQRRRCRRHGLI